MSCDSQRWNHHENPLVLVLLGGPSPLMAQLLETPAAGCAVSRHPQFTTTHRRPLAVSATRAQGGAKVGAQGDASSGGEASAWPGGAQKCCRSLMMALFSSGVVWFHMSSRHST